MSKDYKLVKVDSTSQENVNILVNPSDEEYNEMHISRVTTFDRKREDSEDVNICKYEKGGSYQITDELNSNTDNPSDRRDGLIIYFHPENGDKELFKNCTT